MANIIEVNDLTIPELAVYACRSEVLLLRYYEPQPGIFIAESPRVIQRALDAGYQPLSLLVDRKVLAGEYRGLLERCGEIPVYAAEADVLAQITGFHLTQGFLCAMRRRSLPSFREICVGAARVAVLEDIENPTNVGAVFRCAAGLNFDAVLLTRDCCDPLYRRAVRVSMGTVFQIPWTFLEDRDAGYVDSLREMGFASAAMALREDSVGIDDPRLMKERRLAVLLGNENFGLRDETVCACDYTVRIPMSHGVDSLNVAAASAVAFWQLGRR